VSTDRGLAVAGKSGAKPGRLTAALIGAGGVILAGLITALIGKQSGTLTVLVGPAPTSTVAGPTVTVPGPTVTAAGPTVTVPGPTVTVAGNSGSDLVPLNAIHLADSSNVPEGILVGKEMDDASNLGIDGKIYDFGWTAYGAPYYGPSVILGINTNQAYSKFQARVGVAATSANTSGKLLILTDGKVAYTCNVDLKNSVFINLPIKGVQRIEIKRLPSENEGMIYAIGDPLLVP
jgi:hypothetical protein